MSQAGSILSVSEHFERAVTAATKPLVARIEALEVRNAQLEKDLLALRRAAAALVQRG